jgi:hypothetical protein
MNASEDNAFRISIGDDPEHEDLTAEIYFRGEYFALISQEQGLQNAVIEIQPNPKGGAWLFSLSDFTITIDLAKKRLWELRRS